MPVRLSVEDVILVMEENWTALLTRVLNRYSRHDFKQYWPTSEKHRL